MNHPQHPQTDGHGKVQTPIWDNSSPSNLVCEGNATFGCPLFTHLPILLKSAEDLDWNLTLLTLFDLAWWVQISWENRWIETNPFDIGFILRENSDCLLSPALEHSCAVFYSSHVSSGISCPQGHSAGVLANGQYGKNNQVSPCQGLLQQTRETLAPPANLC